MKKWIKFFFLSFFSNTQAKEGIKRGYTNVFISLMIALICICLGLIGADTLPFGAHYDNATPFKTLVRNALTCPDDTNGISVIIENDRLLASKNGNYEKALIVDTFNNEQDKQVYANDGYQLVIDTRSADALAVVDAYCVSTDEQKTVISYEDYLTLNDVAKRNFEFKLKYTGNELVLTDITVAEFKAYLDEKGNENANALFEKFSRNEITKSEYDRGIYELYFETYYPSIIDYESNSKVPLLRNYYFHELIGKGENRFLMIFDDCLVGSFATDGNIEVFFYGFYNSVNDGTLINSNLDNASRIKAVDTFIKNSFKSTNELSAYIYLMNTVRLIPIIAVMVIVVTMLTSSILALKGVETCKTFGASMKVVGSFLWTAGIITAILSIIISFMVQRNLITVVTVVSFFITLLVRAVFFIVDEIKKRKLELENLSSEELNQEVSDI